MPSRSRLDQRWLIAAVASALILPACGGDPKHDDHVASPTTAAAGATITATPSLGSPPASPAAAQATVTPGAVSETTVVATDNAFSPRDFRVRAGQPFSVTLQNRGQALHDWRVLGVKGSDGKDVGTSLLPTGQAQSVTLTIERPGEYAVYCEVHPVEMRGRLIVE